MWQFLSSITSSPDPFINNGAIGLCVLAAILGMAALYFGFKSKAGLTLISAFFSFLLAICAIFISRPATDNICQINIARMNSDIVQQKLDSLQLFREAVEKVRATHEKGGYQGKEGGIEHELRLALNTATPDLKAAMEASRNLRLELQSCAAGPVRDQAAARKPQ